MTQFSILEFLRSTDISVGIVAHIQYEIACGEL